MTQIWLEAPILLEQIVNKVGLTELKRGQVSEIDLHGCLLVLLDLISLLDIKLDGLSRNLMAICVEDVVWVIFTQHEARRMDQGQRDNRRVGCHELTFGGS